MIRLGGAPVPAEEGYLRLPPPILTMNLTVLDQPEEILAAARKAVAAGKHRPVQEHKIWLPRQVAQRSGRSGDTNHLDAPVDQRLEVLARRLLQLPGDFTGGNSGFENLLRREGLAALRYFKSEENIALVRPFLADLSWLVETRGTGNGAEVKRWVYYLRKEAYATLRHWKVEIREPLLEERLPR